MGNPRSRSGRQQGGCELLMPRGRRTFQAIDASMDGPPLACFQGPSNGRLGLADLPKLGARGNTVLAREQRVRVTVVNERSEGSHGNESSDGVGQECLRATPSPSRVG